jgi:hypothetical protein
LSPVNQLTLTPLQADTILTRFKEIGILRDEIREIDGRTLRYLFFIREHPLVQKIIGTPN